MMKAIEINNKPIIKVLIVEDEAIIALDIKFMLAKKGYQVVKVCNSCQEALVFLKHSSIDLVLLNMDQNGCDVINYLEKNNIPVLFLADNTEEMIAVDFSNGDQKTFLQKPFTKDQLLEGVYKMQMSA